MNINTISYERNTRLLNSPKCNSIQITDKNFSNPNFGGKMHVQKNHSISELAAYKLFPPKSSSGCLTSFLAAAFAFAFVLNGVVHNKAEKKAEQNKEILNNTIKANFQNSKDDKTQLNDAITFAETYLPSVSELADLHSAEKTNRNFQKLNNLIKEVTSPSSEGGSTITLNEKRIVDNICGKNSKK